jgi:UrcA family protein
MSIRFMPAFIAAAFCLAATAAPRDAIAAQTSIVTATSDQEPFRFTYRFDADQLQTASGTQRVYRNLIRNAQRACASGMSTLSLYRMDRRCAAALVDNVVLRIGSPALAALHAGSLAAGELTAASRGRSSAD